MASWLVSVLSVVIIWLWNWKLFLATVAGISLMLLVYWLQNINYQSYLLRLKRFFTGQHRHLTIAVGSGGIGALITYTAASIWANSENRWLAVGGILQGLATMLTLGLVSWQFLTFKKYDRQIKFEEMLQDLTDIIPLKRLIAVRKLANLLNEKTLSKNQYYQLLQYLRIMLATEEELIIQDAIWEALNKWNPQELTVLEQPLDIPLENIASSSGYHYEH